MKTIALVISLLGLVVASHATVTETFQHSYPLAATGSISLKNVNGDIVITAWDKSEVSLVAEKRAKDDAELKRVDIIIEAEPARLSIQTKITKTAGWNTHSSVQYRLMVPVGATLDKIDAVNSDITVSGVHGQVRLETVNGRIAAAGLHCDSHLESVNGNLRAEYDTLQNAQEVKLESVNGHVEVILPSGASARLKTSTVHGRCSIEQPIKLSNSENHNLAGDIGGASGPAVTLETVNGGIDVKEARPQAR